MGGQRPVPHWPFTPLDIERPRRHQAGHLDRPGGRPEGRDVVPDVLGAGELVEVGPAGALGLVAQRPVHGGEDRYRTDPYWRDLVLFYEYFHGDNGAGIGASHQTGWTGLVAKLLQQSGE